MAEEQEAKQLELPEVIVKIDEESAAPDTVVKTEPKEDAVKDLADQYKELEKSKDEAIARADAARQETERYRREADLARAAAASSNLDTINGALQSAQAALDAAKRAHKVAREAGDYEAELEAIEAIADAKDNVRTYDEAKSNIEARKTAPTHRQEERDIPADPVEAYVRNRTEETAKWLREHREFIVDPRKNAKLTAAHYNAVAEGHQPDTSEYFKFVEEQVGLRQKEPQKVEEAARKRSPARPVAPVRAGSNSGDAINGNEVRLNPREAAAAIDGTHIWNYDDPSGQKRFKKGDPIGVQEFARRKKKMTEDGQYDRSLETQ